MVLKKRQIRYVLEGDPRNSAGATRASLIGGSLFNASTRIVELRVTAIPGFGFYVNDTPFPIRILPDAVSFNDSSDRPDRLFYYDFPAEVLTLQPIYNIKCEAASLERLIEYNSRFNPPYYLMIDYVEEVND